MSTERPLRILLVDDEEIIHQTIGDYLRDEGHRVESAYDGTAALKSIEVHEYDLALIDVRMPGMDGMALLNRVQEIRPAMPVVIITGHGSMENVIQALRSGAADFLTKPVKLLELDAVLEKCLRFRTLSQERMHLRETIGTIQVLHELRTGDRTLVGNSSATRKVRNQIVEAVGAGCDTILITGETGTGKEVAAREIHHQAASDESPFIAVSCPALPESLLESELFGHVKGAFTGATQDKAGYFEIADGGTLFLDEVADLSPSAQAALLRVIETREVRRVGGSQEIKVQVRLIAASNAQLEKLVERRKFRPDLFYRLNGFTIHLLPLRERSKDILPLAEHFLSTYAIARKLHFDGFSLEAKDLLLSYEWPGNARELRNVIERAAILCKSGQIKAEHMSLSSSVKNKITPKASGEKSKDDERALILKILEETKWNRKQAARRLDMPYSTFRYKLKKLGIE